MSKFYFAARRRTHCDSVDGMDAARRVAFAKMYEALDQVGDLNRANAILRDRITVVLQEMDELVDHILTGRNIDAFKHALALRQLLDQRARGERDGR